MSNLRVYWKVLALVWVLPGMAMAAPPEIPFSRNHLQWTITTGGGSGIVVAVTPQEISGKIALCGAVWPLNEKREAMASRDRVFREAIIELRGKPVPASLNVFPVYDSQEAAKTFRCSVSNKPWQGPYKGDEIKARLRTSAIRD